MAECAAGQTCELLAGAGAFCQGAIVGADAGPTPTDDAGPPGDAGPDTDGDGDGIPSSTDCDDTNAAIGTMNVESCMGACGFGTVVCTNGVRTACSAATDCSCPTPGEVRTIPCGRCGIASQSCGADSRWSVPSACTDEHECITGAVEARTPRCGREERVCDSTCMWRSWSEVVPPRECEPGEEDTLMNEFCGIAAVDVRTCQDDCLYGPSEGCRPLCRRGPRTSRIGAATTCIPEGEFILGTTTYADAMPVRTIAISDFWVAVDPATAGEYRRCVTEGGCTAVEAPSFAALTDRQAAVGVTQMQAAMFCAWDGGELITEFQWEKAARGPAPSRQEHPWGDVTRVQLRPDPSA
jgi:hypothetical protein